MSRAVSYAWVSMSVSWAARVGSVGAGAARGKIELFQPVSNPFEPEYIDTSCCFRAHFVHISDECIEISIKYSIDLTPCSNPDESGVLEPKTLKTAIKGHFLPVWARV